MSRAHSVLARVILLAATPAAAADGQVFALVVANNRSLDAAVAPLRYADDDGARFYELLTSMPKAQVEVLAGLDEETQRLFPAVAAQARAPTFDELRHAVERLRGAMSEARERGVRPVFYFYFAGHGNVGTDREGYLNLADARLARSDIFREIIARSNADVTHVIIDACNSYFAVNRGDAAAARPAAAVRSFLEAESLEHYPNTGVVLSTASEADSHEWSRFKSGVFSHELLSALLGAADIDADGRVGYPELAAYVAAANVNVQDARARLVIYARPPAAHRDAPLIALDRPDSALVIPEPMTGHYYLEDDRGVRFADFNKTAEQPLRIALLGRPYYYLRSAEREALVSVAKGVVLDAGTLAFAEIDTRRRGSVEHSLMRDLYTFPFGRSFFAGYGAAATRGLPESPPGLAMTPADRGVWKWTSAAIAGAGAVAGASFLILASRASRELERDPEVTMERAVELQNDNIRMQTAAGASLGVAAMAALSFLAATYFDATVPVTAVPVAGGGETAWWLSGRF